MKFALRFKLSHRLLFAALLLGGIASCNFGEPTAGGGGTGVEGIAGHVVVPGGGPAAGASVKVYPVSLTALEKGGSHLFPAVDSVIVNASGHFSFPELAAGTYNLVVSVRSGDTTLGLLVTGIIVSDTGADLGTDTLKISGKIVLDVKSGTTPLSGASCYVPSTPYEAVSDTSGRCTLNDIPPGTFEITVSHPQYEVGISGEVSVLPGLISSGGLLILVNAEASPPAPILLMPAAGANASSEDLFSWATVGGASRYHLQVTMGDDSAFNAPLRSDTGLTATTAPVIFKSQGIPYLWRVRAGNAIGYGSWSAIRTFVTGDGTAIAFHFALTPSTVALWRFDQSDLGGIIRDLGPNAFHLVPVSTSVPLEPSPAGKAAVFNGTTHKLTTPFDSTLTVGPTGKLTFEARLKLDAYPAVSLLGSGADVVGSYAGLALKIRSDGTFLASVQKESSPGVFEWYGASSSAGIVPLNRWTTLSISVDQTVTPHQFYGFIDGIAVPLYAIPDTRPIRIRTEPFMVGHRDNDDDVGFTGRIDEIRISNQLMLGAGHPLTAQSLVVLPAARDAMIWGSALDLPLEGVHSNKNAGDGIHLEVGVYDRNTITRSLIAFPMPAGRSGTSIASAKIRLTIREWHAKHVVPATINIRAHRILRSWNEGLGSSDASNPNSATIDGVTSTERFFGNQDGSEDWNVKLVGLDGIDADVAPSASMSIIPGVTGTVEIDITTLARFWADNPGSNHGLVLVGDIPADDLEAEDYPVFHSSEAEVPGDLKPTLLIYSE